MKVDSGVTLNTHRCKKDYSTAKESMSKSQSRRVAIAVIGRIKPAVVLLEVKGNHHMAKVS